MVDLVIDIIGCLIVLGLLFKFNCVIFMWMESYFYMFVLLRGVCMFNDKSMFNNKDSYYGKNMYVWYCFEGVKVGIDGERYYIIVSIM